MTFLLTEDRPDFERLLDAALRDTRYPTGTGRGQARLDAGQLRELALSATAAISASASPEYERYVLLRSAQRRASGDVAPDRAEGGIRFGAAPIGGGGRAGLPAVLAVLAPLLAGAAAVLFLLVGYLLQLMNPDPSVASNLRQAGWIFALFTGAAIVVATVTVVTTARRSGGPPTAVERAREEWLEALLERGIRPFLEEAIAGGAAGAAVPSGFTAPRFPRFGYSRPAFTSPDDGGSTDGPWYSNPDYTSPDYGGPEQDPE
ncbi:hypothetical protein [Streptomyces phytophilus]|uniref:hypothetical protein n=1 Tax=Streptomyces phytophilus TaxID=722715 RepID=UPI002867F97B|nr:hypothetical protein [Streptomyces phytophilus]